MLPPGDFDAHQVVVFDLNVPAHHLHTFHLPLPRTWVDLDLDYKHMPAAYDHASNCLGTPTSLMEWGNTVECAVDCAYRQAQLAAGIHPTLVKPLPKSYRGRCKPRKPERTPKVLLTKLARTGDYAYNGEIIRRATQAKVKQVRRVQSLYGRLRAAGKDVSFSKFHELQAEWLAILRSRSFGKNFVLWCQTMPELGPPPGCLPSLDYLYTMLQLLKHATNEEMAFDKKLRNRKYKYATHLDRMFYGNKLAYDSIKRPCHATPNIDENSSPRAGFCLCPMA